MPPSPPGCFRTPFKLLAGFWTRAVAEFTSILRPSTIVPCSFSRACSASEPTANVTNPKPFNYILNYQIVRHNTKILISSIISVQAE